MTPEDELDAFLAALTDDVRCCLENMLSEEAYWPHRVWWRLVPEGNVTRALMLLELIERAPWHRGRTASYRLTARGVEVAEASAELHRAHKAFMPPDIVYPKVEVY